MAVAETAAVVAKKIGEKIAVETAKDPNKVLRCCVCIAAAVCSIMVLFMLLIQSLISCFWGELLNTPANMYAAAMNVSTSIGDYMASMLLDATGKQDEITAEHTDVTIYSDYRVFDSLSKVNEHANLLREEYSQVPDLISCVVDTNTTHTYKYVFSGKTPDGRGFTETKEFASEAEADEHAAWRMQFGYTELTRSLGTNVYKANYTITVSICEIEFDTKWNTIPMSYVLAYFTTKNDEAKVGNVVIDPIETLTFLADVSPLITIDLSDTDKKVSFFNQTKSPEQVAADWWADDEIKQGYFLASQKAYADMLGEAGVVYIDYSYVYLESGIPKFYQTNYKSVAYGNGTIASSGCGPTCMAMVTTYMIEYVVNPIDMCKWAGNTYFVSGAGTTWSFFPAAAEAYGFNCTNLGLDYEAVLDAIADGKPVIASMGPGTFTSSGHYIVIRGMTDEGKLLVNDPNQRNEERYGTDEFDSAVVLGEAKNFWCFDK